MRSLRHRNRLKRTIKSYRRVSVRIVHHQLLPVPVFNHALTVTLCSLREEVVNFLRRDHRETEKQK